MLLTSIFLVGCSAPPDEVKATRFVDGSALCASADYIDNSCAFGAYPDGFNRGGDLIDTASKISKTFFEKTFDEAFLTRVSAASPRLTLSSMERAGVRVFQNGERCGCAIFKGIAKSDDLLFNHWQKASGSNGKSTLLGLFLTKEKVAALGSPIDSAAILIRGDTDRWTLVHEYMHFLFQKNNEVHGADDKQIFVEYQNAMADLADLAFAPTAMVITSETQKQEIEQRFKLDIETIKSYLINFPLEEMTIEAHLSDMHRSGDLKYVPPKARKIAARYICYKFEDTRRLTDRIFQLGKLVVDRFEKQKFDTTLLQMQLLGIRGLISEARGINSQFGLGEACVPGSRETFRIYALMKSCGHGQHFDSSF
ncbi:MAG: hypothetical protein V4736_00205 [Bdellovibrionota bacterium]